MFKYGGEGSYKTGIRGLGLVRMAHQQPITQVYGGMNGETSIPVYQAPPPQGVRYTIPHYKYPGMGNALFPFASKFSVASGTPRTLSGLGDSVSLNPYFATIMGSDGGAQPGTQNDPDMNFADPSAFWDIFGHPAIHDFSSLMQFEPWVPIGAAVVALMLLTGRHRR